MLDNRVQAMPGDEVWLVGERRLTGEQNTTSQIYLPTPPSKCSPRRSRRDGSASKHISSSRKNWARSEEHTSELQSLMRISYAVFCLTKNKPTLRTHIHSS